MLTIPQNRKKGRTRLIPLRLSPSRHLRVFHGITQVELSAGSGISLKRVIAAELGDLQLTAAEEAARDRALHELGDVAKSRLIGCEQGEVK